MKQGEGKGNKPRKYCSSDLNKCRVIIHNVSHRREFLDIFIPAHTETRFCFMKEYFDVIKQGDFLSPRLASLKTFFLFIVVVKLKGIFSQNKFFISSFNKTVLSQS